MIYTALPRRIRTSARPCGGVLHTPNVSLSERERQRQRDRERHRDKDKETETRVYQCEVCEAGMQEAASHWPARTPCSGIPRSWNPRTCLATPPPGQLLHARARHLAAAASSACIADRTVCKRRPEPRTAASAPCQAPALKVPAGRITQVTTTPSFSTFHVFHPTQNTVSLCHGQRECCNIKLNQFCQSHPHHDNTQYSQIVLLRK